MNTPSKESPTTFIASLQLLEDILYTSDTIVIFILPVFDEDNIIDFELKYLSTNHQKYVASTSTPLLNKSGKELLPVIFSNGVFEILKACYSKTDMNITFERAIAVGTDEYWFESNARKQSEGILLSVRDITKLKISEQKQRELNRLLEFQNVILRDSETISKSASFQWNIKKNTWVYSENMWKLFPSQKHIIEGPKGIFGLIPQEDQKLIEDRVAEFMYDDNFPGHTFSLINDDGTTSTFHLSGNFTPTIDGQLLLGVLQDITQTVKNERLLKEKNEELQLSNEELDSFNHIASHDLQEPLRKIQMFVSRIKESKHTNLSEKEMGYFNKIEDSSDRMQTLINHLLAYSRIGKIEQEQTELNVKKLIDEQLENYIDPDDLITLSVHINDSHKIVGTEFLIQQLLSNLIGNAFKYKKKEEPLYLEITSELLSSTELNHLDFVKSSVNYIALSIQDNGIGFEQQHADKIFELFQRLHQKQVYKGTGIGLAICKKIVLTHQGYITAHSEPERGANFTVYLPTDTENRK